MFEKKNERRSEIKTKRPTTKQDDDHLELE